MTLKELLKIIEDRKKKMPEGSYVASLFSAGKDQIIQKVGKFPFRAGRSFGYV